MNLVKTLSFVSRSQCPRLAQLSIIIWTNNFTLEHMFTKFLSIRLACNSYSMTRQSGFFQNSKSWPFVSHLLLLQINCMSTRMTVWCKKFVSHTFHLEVNLFEVPFDFLSALKFSNFLIKGHRFETLSSNVLVDYSQP